MTVSEDIAAARAQYEVARAAKTGEATNCPTCKVLLIKSNYQQVFCSNSGAGNCKDHYWNLLAQRNPLVPKAKRTAHEHMTRQLIKLRPLVVAAMTEDSTNDEQVDGRWAQLQKLLERVEEVINDPR
jgi:hypothetical protein